MKLTKPPEKKSPIGPGSKTTPISSKQAVKNISHTKPSEGVNILDLDLGSMTIN